MDELEAMHWLLKETLREQPYTGQEAQALWKEFQGRVRMIGNRAAKAPAFLELAEKEKYEANYLMNKCRRKPAVLGVAVTASGARTTNSPLKCKSSREALSPLKVVGALWESMLRVLTMGPV